MILEYKRGYGLFSNLNVLQRTLATHLVNGQTIEDIQLILPEYFNYDRNLYREFFHIQPNVKIDEADLRYMLAVCPSDIHGLFNRKVELQKVNQLKHRFLSFSDKLVDSIKYLQQDYRFPNEFFFAWYRGTDKNTETSIVEFSKFVDKIRELNPTGLPIYVKTDSIRFTEYMFTKSNLRFENIVLIRLHEDETALCGGRIRHIDDAVFEREEHISKVEYLRQLIALTYIASKAKVYLATSSNINTFVIQNRGNYDNVHIYKDANSFLF